jgi:hypothetical protein
MVTDTVSITLVVIQESKFWGKSILKAAALILILCLVGFIVAFHFPSRAIQSSDLPSLNSAPLSGGILLLIVKIALVVFVLFYCRRVFSFKTEKVNLGNDKTSRIRLSLFLFVTVLVILAILPSYGPWDFDFIYYIRKQNFFICLLFCLGILAFVLIKVKLSKQTWGQILEVTNYSGIPACTVGGIGFLAMNDKLQVGLLNSALPYSQLSTTGLEIFFIMILLLLLITRILIQVGKAMSGDAEAKSNQPRSLFVPAFYLSWICNLGIYTLLFNTIFVTLIACTR